MNLAQVLTDLVDEIVREDIHMTPMGPNKSHMLQVRTNAMKVRIGMAIDAAVIAEWEACAAIAYKWSPTGGIVRDIRARHSLPAAPDPAKDDALKPNTEKDPCAT